MQQSQPLFIFIKESEANVQVAGCKSENFSEAELRFEFKQFKPVNFNWWPVRDSANIAICKHFRVWLSLGVRGQGTANYS